jgi:RNA polymerase sigma factor (sigma-70 family)
MSTAEIGPWSEAPATGPIPVPRSAWQPNSAAGAPARGLGRPPGPRAGTGPVTVTDAALAVAATRDPAAFAAIYDRYSDRLHDFCLGMLRDRDAAADCVQDTFTTAATRLSQLREPDKLRPWLYAIARHEALRRIRSRRREEPIDELPDRASPEHGPEELAARNELAELVTQAAGGVSDRDRAVLDLHYRHGLDGPELADALGVSATNANTLVSRLSTTLERSLGALLLARGVRGAPGAACPELVDLLAAWDGQFSVLWRKRIARHSDHCPTCLDKRQALTNPRALLGSAPALIPAPGWLRSHVLGNSTPLLGHTPGAAAAAGAPAGSSSSWWSGAARSAVLKPLHLAVIAPLLAAGSAVGLMALSSPTDTTETSLSASTSPDAAVAPSTAPSFGFDMPTTHLPGAPTDPPPGTTPGHGQAPAAGAAGAPPVQPPTGPVPPGQAPAGSQVLPNGATVPAPVPPPPPVVPTSTRGILGDLGGLATGGGDLPGLPGGTGTPPRHKQHHHRPTPTTTTPPTPR